MKRYDVIITGAGPAGIFCALELIRRTDLKVLIIDKGEGLEGRECPVPSGPCRRCKPCANLCGWGGAGAFSDGKLMLSRDIGGWLADIVPAKKLDKLIDKVD
ncbi:MAG: NAD(P)/FAD-dependent oxidoreductase, partial [Actinobacteria bacterium]|nr:NAD(P)/FAD-dependent oxidoreductase [Actinomycetota bacterium]